MSKLDPHAKAENAHSTRSRGPSSADPRVEVVLKVGFEGGSVAIVRRFTAAGGWLYSFQRNESALADLLDEEDARGLSFEEERDGPTFEEAFARFDLRPWRNGYPLCVHPEFRDVVWGALLARERDSPVRSSVAREWAELCGRGAPTRR